MGVTYLNAIALSAVEPDAVFRTAESARQLLHRRHAIGEVERDDFRVRTLEEVVAVRTRTARTMTVLLAVVAGVSLVVSGIGVMNIMLVSVTERARELGLRLAVGARSRDVLLQFVVEALIVAILGGVGGVALGYVCSLGLTHAFAWQTELSSRTALLALGVAGITGVIFGWYPAWRAASTEPIAALRFE
jgi:putative ABC transport system permease protein